MKSVLVFLLGIFAVFYLLNPGWGLIEFLPDNLPYVGNLDEGGAALLLLMCLRYFGLDPTRLLQRDKTRKGEPEAAKQPKKEP